MVPLGNSSSIVSYTHYQFQAALTVRVTKGCWVIKPSVTISTYMGVLKEKLETFLGVFGRNRQHSKTTFMRMTKQSSAHLYIWNDSSLHVFALLTLVTALRQEDIHFEIMMASRRVPLKLLISCHKVSSEWHSVPIKLKPYVSDKIVLVNLKFSLCDK